MDRTGGYGVKIIVIEDNADLNELLVEELVAEGFEATGHLSVEACTEAASQADLYLLDMNLPGESGLSFAARLRASRPEVGIVVLTVRTGSEIRTNSYDSGADIYLQKPCESAEIIGPAPLPFYKLRGHFRWHVMLKLPTLVNQQGGVSAVVQNHIWTFASRAFFAGEFKNAVCVIPVLGQVLALHRKHRRARCGNGSRSVVLCRVNVARCPAHIGAQSLQGFNQHGCLNGHVQGTCHARTFEGLSGCEFFANGHQTGHFCLGNFEFFAAPIGQADIGNDAISVEGRV